MEDDGIRLSTPIKVGWNLLLEGILEKNRETPIFGEDHPAVQNSIEELSHTLQRVSKYRHQLNCRFETIKKEVESLQLKTHQCDSLQKTEIENSILKLEEEGYALQLELERLEMNLKKIRNSERDKSESHSI